MIDKNTRVFLVLASLVFLLPLIQWLVCDNKVSVRSWQYLFTPFLLLSILGIQFEKKTPVFHVISFLEKKLGKIPLIFYIVLFFLSAFCLYLVIPIANYLSFRINAIDFGIFESMINNTLKGRWMESSLHDFHHFGIHPSWILLLLVPLQYFFSDTSLFLLLVGGFLAFAGSIPLGKLVYNKTGSRNIALLFCFVYLTSPFTAVLVNQNFRIESFYPLFLFSFILFFEQKRFFLTILFLTLLFSVKEDICFYMFALGIGCLLKKDLRWSYGLPLTLLSGTYALLCLLYIKPYFLPQQSNSYFVFWSHYGHDLKTIIVGMLSSPDTILKDIFTSGLYKLYLPLLFIPFFSFLPTITMLPGIFLLGTASSYPLMHQYNYYYPLILFCLALWGYLNVFSSPFVQKRPFLRKWIIIPLLCFPLFHAGYLSLPKPDLKTFQDIQTLKTILKGKPLCLTGNLFSYFPESERHILDASCFKNQNILFAPKMDPYPLSQGDFKVLREAIKTHVSSCQETDSLIFCSQTGKKEEEFERMD